MKAPLPEAAPAGFSLVPSGDHAAEAGSRPGQGRQPGGPEAIVVGEQNPETGNGT